MLETTQNWIEAVKYETAQLQLDFQRIKGLILTEGDLECELYSRLKRNRNFNNYIQNESSDWKTGFVHSQVTWFKQGQHSGFEVDLTILNPARLSIDALDLSIDYPHKGFFYDGECIGIELKFIRDGTNNSIIKRNSLVDYKKIIEGIRIAKDTNIANGMYTRANMNNVVLFSVIACKNDAIFNICLAAIQRAIGNTPCPQNVFVIVFSHSNFIILPIL